MNKSENITLNRPLELLLCICFLIPLFSVIIWLLNIRLKKPFSIIFLALNQIRFPTSPAFITARMQILLLLQYVMNCSYCIYNIQFRYALVSDQHLHALTKRFSTRSSSFCCLGSVCVCSACARLSSSSGCRRSAPSPPYS